MVERAFDNVETIIARVHAMSRGRTRYEGQPAHWDEVLVAEIERLRAELARREEQVHRIQQQLNRMPAQLTQPRVEWADP